MTPEQNELKDLCYRAYLRALKPTTTREVLDALQDAYWQGLEMEPDYAPPAEDPPF